MPRIRRREDVTDEPDGGESRLLNAGATIEFPTRLRGWYSSSSFTKTQYAANPKYGGTANFLRAHLSVFKAIDEAKRLGMKTRIRDDARYWRHRDEAKLVKELAKHDEMIAGFVGRLGDALGDAGAAIVAPIKARSDFEHLEAKDASIRNKPKQKRHKGKDNP